MVIALPISIRPASAVRETATTGNATEVRSATIPEYSADPITGIWSGTYGPGAYPFVLKLRLEGEIVSGEATIDGNTGAISQGTWKNGELSITVLQKGNRIAFRGWLSEGGLSGRQYLNGSTNFLQWTASKK